MKKNLVFLQLHISTQITIQHSGGTAKTFSRTQCLKINPEGNKKSVIGTSRIKILNAIKGQEQKQFTQLPSS